MKITINFVTFFTEIDTRDEENFKELNILNNSVKFWREKEKTLQLRKIL